MPRDKPTTDKEDMTNGEQNQKEPSLPLMYLGTRVGAGMLWTEQGIDKMRRRILFSSLLFPFLRWTKGHLAPKERKREVGKGGKGGSQTCPRRKEKEREGERWEKNAFPSFPLIKTAGGGSPMGTHFYPSDPFPPSFFFSTKEGGQHKESPTSRSEEGDPKGCFCLCPMDRKMALSLRPKVRKK